MKIKVFYVFGYMICDIVFSFFVDANTILTQTFFNLYKIGGWLILLDLLPFKILQFKFLIIVTMWYFVGSGIMFIINAFRFTNYTSWMIGFNDYGLLLPVYVVMLLGAIVHSYRIIK